MVVETEPEITAEMTTEETNEEIIVEPSVEPTEKQDVTEEQENDGQDETAEGGNGKVWILMGGIGLLVIIAWLVVGKKKTRQ